MLMLQMLARGQLPVSTKHPLDVRVVTAAEKYVDATIKVTLLPNQQVYSKRRATNMLFLVVMVLQDDTLLDVDVKQEEIIVAHFGGIRK